jgi:hypothetical protein
MSLLPFFQWCDATAIGAGIRNSRFLFPIIETFHLLALTVLLGSVVIAAMGLIGAAARGQPVSALAKTLAPLTFWGAATMIFTGSMLFLSEALKCYENPPFWFKMTALLLAIVFHWTVVRPAIKSTRPMGRLRGFATAAGCLILWFSVGAGGRAIGFY